MSPTLSPSEIVVRHSAIQALVGGRGRGRIGFWAATFWPFRGVRNQKPWKHHISAGLKRLGVPTRPEMIIIDTSMRVRLSRFRLRTQTAQGFSTQTPLPLKFVADHDLCARKTARAAPGHLERGRCSIPTCCDIVPASTISASSGPTL